MFFALFMPILSWTKRKTFKQQKNQLPMLFLALKPPVPLHQMPLKIKTRPVYHAMKKIPPELIGKAALTKRPT